MSSLKVLVLVLIMSLQSSAYALDISKWGNKYRTTNMFSYEYSKNQMLPIHNITRGHTNFNFFLVKKGIGLSFTINR
jgi:hypothetical protein